MRNVIAAALLIAACALAAFADIARPDKPKSGNTKKPVSIDTVMEIRLDHDAKTAKLVIPRSQVKQLRAELESLDDNGDTATTATGGMGRLQTIVSGTFLSLAILFAGVWFVRTRSTKSAAAIAVLAVTSFAVAVYGNIGPPPEARSITGKMFSNAVHMYKQGSGKIKLEISDTDQNVTLIVPDTKDDKSEE